MRIPHRPRVLPEILADCYRDFLAHVRKARRPPARLKKPRLIKNIVRRQKLFVMKPKKFAVLENSRAIVKRLTNPAAIFSRRSNRRKKTLGQRRNLLQLFFNRLNET